MLDNPNWQQHTKADPSELATLKAWLATKPADGTYDWESPCDCLAAQYLREITGQQHHSSEFLTMPHYYNIAQPTPHTYGAALERAIR